MIRDHQVRKLWEFLEKGMPLGKAAWKSGMSEKTARKYRSRGQLPSETTKPREWRTRKDPFEEVWSEVEEQLTATPDIEGKSLFEWLQRKQPNRFSEGQLRSFQRRVKQWRATSGPAKEVFFGQVHHPGRLCASDFTHMTELGVTIAGQTFEHMVYHFVLTYSNWESATICFSESFENLSEGLQNALWELGGVPDRHRSDRLSAAINNLTPRRAFTARYRGLMNHYRLTMEKTGAGKGNENGDVESLHRHFKRSVKQALLLRGSHDFADRSEYTSFLNEIVAHKNSGRVARLAEERSLLRPLPATRQSSTRQLEVKVNSGSLIRVLHNVYSVKSRLIGEKVQVRVHAEHLEIWFAQKEVARLPRLHGRGKHRINYRHIIDWLVRKPGAFENYRYRDALFPTSRFRMAYDLLCDSGLHYGAKEYVRILELAAKEGETLVDDALRVLLDRPPLTLDRVQEFVEDACHVPSTTDVHIAETDLSSFDSLLTSKEGYDGQEDRCEIDVSCEFA
jgi:hypothetical protein